MKTGLELIAEERQRQINEENYSIERDRSLYQRHELYLAASCYFAAKRVRAICGGKYDPKEIPNGWPFAGKYWKPTPDNRIRELQKAGALYEAENDVRPSQLCLSQRDLCAKEIDEILEAQRSNNTTISALDKPITIMGDLGMPIQNDVAQAQWERPLTPTKELTFGQKAVGLTFNPSGDDAVAKAKQTFADAIDQLNDLRNSTTSEKVRGMCSIGITEAQTAQMWAVKALTWRD